LLYEYKSTNTDEVRGARHTPQHVLQLPQKTLLSLLLQLLLQLAVVPLVRVRQLKMAITISY